MFKLTEKIANFMVTKSAEIFVNEVKKNIAAIPGSFVTISTDGVYRVRAEALGGVIIYRNESEVIVKNIPYGPPHEMIVVDETDIQLMVGDTITAKGKHAAITHCSLLMPIVPSVGDLIKDIQKRAAEDEQFLDDLKDA